MGFAVVAADMAARIGLVDFLNARVFWDPKQCKVSPGLRILALIIGCLVDPLALYRLEEFYAELDCAVLFGAERQAHDFNDDAMGRALLKLFESQVGQTFTARSRQAVERLALPGYASTTTLLASIRRVNTGRVGGLHAVRMPPPHGTPGVAQNGSARQLGGSPTRS